MSPKAVFFVVCCFVVAVNAFSMKRSDDERKPGAGAASMYPFTVSGRRGDYRSNEEGQYGGNREGSTEGRGYPSQGQYDGRSGGQRVGLKYSSSSSSSSSSSEERSQESYEVRKVEKQYHDTDGYNNGNSRYEPGHSRHYKVRNFEAADLHNAIDKDM